MDGPTDRAGCRVACTRLTTVDIETKIVDIKVAKHKHLKVKKKHSKLRHSHRHLISKARYSILKQTLNSKT